MPGWSLKSKGPVPVRLAAIDNEIQKHNLSIGFIKIDIEGYQCDRLRGVIRILKTQHPIL
jgi:FkbM family methyltransferase